MNTKFKNNGFKIYQIGKIERINEKKVQIRIDEPFRPALRQLDHFSHVIVLWSAHEHVKK